MNYFQRLFHKPFFIRLFNWEYWPFAVAYSPIFIFWLVLSARARSFFFFNASNPSIENGGLLNESKKDIHELLPVHLYPKTIHFKQNIDPMSVVEEVKTAGMVFPLFGKPDVGGRGRGVKKIIDETELIS